MKPERNQVDRIFRAYVDAMLWATMDGADEQGGEPLDRNYGPDDVSEEAERTIRKAIVEFLTADGIEDIAARYDDGDIGHDLFLTRERHGAGFWDGDYEAEAGDGDKLTRAAHALGESEPYVGDDGKIHVYR